MSRPFYRRTFPVSQSFQGRADAASFMEAWVASRIARRGFEVTLMPFTFNDGKDHDLDPDMFVETGYGAERVEVKSTYNTFTGPHDFKDSSPERNLVFISSYNNFLKKNWEGSLHSTMRHYLCTSKGSGAIVWVPVNTPVTIRESYDASRSELFKSVHIERMHLRSFDEFIERLNVGEKTIRR